MSQTTFPVIFAGHGSPMMALETTDVTRAFSRLGAAGTDNAVAFNTTCNLGSIAMTGFTFGM